MVRQGLWPRGLARSRAESSRPLETTYLQSPTVIESIPYVYLLSSSYLQSPTVIVSIPYVYYPETVRVATRRGSIPFSQSHCVPGERRSFGAHKFGSMATRQSGIG